MRRVSSIWRTTLPRRKIRKMSFFILLRRADWQLLTIPTFILSPKLESPLLSLTLISRKLCFMRWKLTRVWSLPTLRLQQKTSNECWREWKSNNHRIRISLKLSRFLMMISHLSLCGSRTSCNPTSTKWWCQTKVYLAPRWWSVQFQALWGKWLSWNR